MGTSVTVKAPKSRRLSCKTLAIPGRSEHGSFILHEMGDERRELWRQRARRFTLQVYSSSDRKKSDAGAFRMIMMGAEYGVVHHEKESNWVQAAFRQDGVSGVGEVCSRNDCAPAHCQRRLGERASRSAGYAISTNQRAGGGSSTNCCASNCTTSFSNGYCRDLAGDAAHSRGGKPSPD